jgi:hypothetical protein
MTAGSDKALRRSERKREDSPRKSNSMDTQDSEDLKDRLKRKGQRGSEEADKVASYFEKRL